MNKLPAGLFLFVVGLLSGALWTVPEPFFREEMESLSIRLGLPSISHFGQTEGVIGIVVLALFVAVMTFLLKRRRYLHLVAEATSLSDKLERQLKSLRDETERVSASGTPQEEETENISQSRRDTLVKTAALLAGGAALGSVVAPRPASAAMAVFDSTNLAEAVKQLNEMVKMVEGLADIARLDKLVFKVLGEIGLDSGLGDSLFSLVSSVKKIIGISVRLKALPSRIKRNWERGLSALEGTFDFSDPDSALEFAEKLYGDGRYDPTTAVKIEAIRADEARKRLVEAIAGMIVVRNNLGKDGSQRVQDLAEAARDAASKSGEQGGTIKSQLAIVSSILIAILEQLQELTGIVATDIEARATYEMSKEQLAWVGKKTIDVGGPSSSASRFTRED